MQKDQRSGCPVSLSLELFGDRWTLLVLRDVIFTGARHFRELLAGEEGISSNTLADRLALLVEHGFLTRAGDPSHKQKVTYSLTEQAIELVPVFVALSDWGVRYLPVDPALAARTAVLVDGGPEMWEAFMDELRATHLGPAARRHPHDPARPSVTAQLNAAVDASAGTAPGHTGEMSHAGAPGR